MQFRTGVIAITAICFSTGVYAADCDQLNQYPNAPGAGPVYEGTSPMPASQGVQQWTCFFKNRNRILDVSAKIVDQKGNLGPFTQYDTTLNYTYYPDQTALKLSFQPNGKSVPPGKWSVTYRIEFDATSQAPSVGPTAGGIGCYNRVCNFINDKGNAYYVNTDNNDVNGPTKLPGGAKGPVSVSCQILSHPEEACAAIDSTGQMFHGSIRPPQKWVRAQRVGSPDQGPFSIACDQTRWCIAISRTGQSWRGPMDDETTTYVSGPGLPE